MKNMCNVRINIISFCKKKDKTETKGIVCNNNINDDHCDNDESALIIIICERNFKFATLKINFGWILHWHKRP